MTFLEWMDVVLRLLCFGWGVCLAVVHAEAIDDWLRKRQAWRAGAIRTPHRKS